MSLDLFAGVPVSDLPRAYAWFEQLLGPLESFDPNDMTGPQGRSGSVVS